MSDSDGWPGGEPMPHWTEKQILLMIYRRVNTIRMVVVAGAVLWLLGILLMFFAVALSAGG